MRNVSNNRFSDEPVLAKEDINYQPEQPEQPCCSGEHSLQNLHKSESTDSISSISDLMQSSSLDSGISGFMQIDCSFVDVDSNIISNLIYSIHSRNLPLYMSSVHLFLESCMNKSLRYLRLFKVEPLTSSEKIDFDPGPDRDEYIVRNAEEYGSLQYMCDYFKYYILGNCTEVVSPMDEFDVNCIKENDCVKIINTIKNKTDVRKCCQLTAKYGPSVEVPSIGTDYRILYTRNGHSLKLSIEKLIQNEVTDSNKKIVNKNFVLKYISPESGKILTNNRIARKIKSSTNNYVSTNDWYASSFIKYHLFINNKFEEISNAKNPIINDSTNMKSIIENKEELRNYDLKIRDILIRSFMRYYLSIKGKFKYICKSRFKGESEIITKEFELPVPEEYSLAAQKTLSDNHRCKINANMEVVRKRMSNYLSEYRHKESVEFYREGSGIIIRDRYKSYAIKFRNMGNMTASDFIFRNISSDKKAEIGKDILTHKSEDIRINSTYKTPPKSFNFISGINISSGITLVDPELVNHGDVADIICSLDNKDVPRYLDAMSNFTAKFMYKSLQYIRALKVELPNYDTTYLINPNMDEYISQNNGTYTRLQYMCDYFKYYILRSHLESLAYKRINIEEEILPLLTTTNDEEGKFKLQIGIDAEEITTAVDDEYELLMESIKVECLDLIENRKKLIDEINENKNKIRSSLRSLECSIRDELIKCLMEYYLLIVDKFESIATLEFKKINRPLNERLVLPVPQAVAEAAHKEIHTGEVLHNYYVRRRNNFFCDENTCLCTKSRVCNTHMVIKIHILEKVIDRMKEYMLSITIKDNGDIVHNSVQLFE